MHLGFSHSIMNISRFSELSSRDDMFCPRRTKGLAMLHESYDVVVVGAGLAGLSAAITAADQGLSVALACDSRLCGGSSFSSSTWGLGMVSETAGQDPRGAESLFKALCDVGMGTNTPDLAKTLIERSPDALRLLRNVGATVTEAEASSQREYVACFDHKVRQWNGFVGSSSKAAFAEALAERDVKVYERFDALSLAVTHDDHEHSERVCGILGVWNRTEGTSSSQHEVEGETLLTLHNLSIPLFLEAKAVILATGGTAGLYEHHLCANTSRDMGHALALDAGATLCNMEFLQLMLGSLSPVPRIIYNEKLYRWSSFVTPEGKDAFAEAGYSPTEAAQALEAHSWHGPFTSERPSKLVEKVLDEAVLAGKPCFVSYDERILGPDAPEFVKTYLSWLKDERGVDPHEPMSLGMYAHSSNGGIRIDAQARTEVKGLFACGECAGGVHGADRIGGLASMTALTFGMVAAESAAKQCAIWPADMALSSKNVRFATQLHALPPDTSHAIAKRVGQILDASCMVARNAGGLSQALDELAFLRTQFANEAVTIDDLEDLEGDACAPVLAASKAQGTLAIATAIATACLRRSESRGSHFRTDCPAHDEAQAGQSVITKQDLYEAL